MTAREPSEHVYHSGRGVAIVKFWTRLTKKLEVHNTTRHTQRPANGM